MAYTYPPVAPTLTGDVTQINRFLETPTLIGRRLRTLAEQRFISDVILPGRFVVEGGAVQFETDEGLYAERPVKAVTPGAEYDLTGLADGTAQIASVRKWGLDSFVTDEAIKRQRMSPVERGMQKLVNSVVKQVDSVALSLVASLATTTQAVTAGAWSAGTPAIFRDIALGKSKMTAQNKGFDPKLLVVDDVTFAYLSSDDKVVAAARREGTDGPLYSGVFPVIAGLTVLPSPNTPGAGAWIIDPESLGGMADENLGGPGYVSENGVGVEGKAIREDAEDRWRIRARRVTVPVVLESGAVVRITGV